MAFRVRKITPGKIVRGRFSPNSTYGDHSPSYAIELSYESGKTVEVPIDATTDSQARKKMKEYIRTNKRQLMDVNAFLSFRRGSDAQHGYLNQDGASPRGKAWE